MSVPFARASSLLVTALLLSPPSAAQGVYWSVSKVDPTADFDVLQDAIDAASDGDTVVLLPGSYALGEVDGKSLRLVSAGEPDSTTSNADAVSIRGLVVRNLAPGQEVLVRGADLRRSETDPAFTYPVVEVQDCAGPVTIEECDLNGSFGGRGDGVVVFDSPAPVTVLRCDIVGGANSAALNVNNGEVHVFESLLRGGRGLSTACQPQKGGKGLNVVDAVAFVSDSTIDGGPGGKLTCVTAPGGDGGDGLVVSGDASYVALLATTVEAGLPASEPGGVGAPGTSQVVNGGLVAPLAGKPRSVEASRLVFEEETLSVALRGETADLAFLLYSPFADPVLLLDCLGPIVPSTPLFTKLVGFVPASGELSFDVSVSGLDPQPETISLWFQGAFFPPDLSCHLSSASLAVVRSCALGVGDLDCNGNGFDDDCDIRRGIEIDVDTDGLPDSCDTFATIVVDDDAPGDPGPGDSSVSDPLEDGTFAHPFDSLEDAFAVAQHGDTILLRDGTYDGEANRSLYVYRNVTLRSENGPATTVLDLQFTGFGLRFRDGTNELGRVEGLTVINGFQPAFIATQVTADYGDGVVIDDCVFEGFTQDAVDGYLQVRNSTFTDNSSSGNALTFEGCTFTRSNARGTWYEDIVLRDCTFVRSSFLATYAKDVVVERCKFRLGDGLSITLPDSFSVRNCAFIRQNGTALGITQSGSGEIVNTTVAYPGQMSTPLGAMFLLLPAGSDVLVENCIVWGGGHTPVRFGNGVGTIRYSAIEGGESAVASNAPFVWGPGNLDVDPHFVTTANAHLLPTSPCIDAGDPAFVPLEGETDLDGNPRVQGAGVDMGAYEAE